MKQENQIAFARKVLFVQLGCMRKGLFTVGALDNLDHNPSSSTGKDSFHGTGTYTSN